MRIAAVFFVFALFASGLKIARARNSNQTLIAHGGLIEYSPIYHR